MTPFDFLKKVKKIEEQYRGDIESMHDALDAVEVVHGRWVLVSKGNFSPGGLEIEEKCSECGRYVYRYEDQPQDNYCPNCGAKMDGGDYND